MTIDEAFALEQPHLLPLPSRPFPCCTLRPVQANGFGLVTFQTNRYSVPANHAHESLWLRVFVDRVEIINSHQTLAVHARCYRREQDILNPLHYLPLLEQRPGAWEQAKPIQQWQQRWPEVYDHYLAALRERLPTPTQATREFVRILRLHEDFPEAIIAQALETALASHCYSADGVKQLVLRLAEPPRSVAPLEDATIASLTTAAVAWPAVEQFDRLLPNRGEGGMSVDIRLSILLRQLRLPTVAANYRKLAQEAVQTGQPYEAYLLALLEQEVNQRDINRIKRDTFR